MGRLGGGRMCSLYLACLRESGFPGATFLGVPLEDLTHTPLALAPPGINLCLTSFRGAFNLVLSYIEGALGDATARGMVAEFKASLV